MACVFHLFTLHTQRWHLHQENTTRAAGQSKQCLSLRGVVGGGTVIVRRDGAPGVDHVCVPLVKGTCYRSVIEHGGNRMICRNIAQVLEIESKIPFATGLAGWKSLPDRESFGSL